MYEYLKEMDHFKNNEMVSTLNVKLLFQEQMEQEVDDKISIASKSACFSKENVTQVYPLMFIIIAQVERMYTDNAKVIDPKKLWWAASAPVSYCGYNKLTCIIFITTYC